MQMRGDGLTNRQIAERLDISYGTVKRYIGNQPKGLRAEYGSYATRVKGVEEVTGPKRMDEADEPRAELTLYQRTDIYWGKELKYAVSGEHVKIRQHDDEIHLQNIAELDTLIQELMHLKRRMMDHG